MPGRAETRCELEGLCICCGEKLCRWPWSGDCLLSHPEAAVAQGSTLPLRHASWVRISFPEWPLLGELPGWVLATQGASPLCLGQKAGGRLQQDVPGIATHPHGCVRASPWRVGSYYHFHESRACSCLDLGEDKSGIQCCHTVVKRHLRR